jgi:acetyl esterase/lipase
LPIGYLIIVVYLAICTAFAAAPPRARHTRQFSVAYWFGFVINEIPVLALELLVASTLLAVIDADLESIGGAITAGLAVVAAVGLIVLSVRGARAAAKLRSDISAMIGPVPCEHHPVRSRQWPFPTRRRNVERLRNIEYGDGVRRLDVYRSADQRGPTLVYLHGGAFRSGDKRRQALPLMQTLAQRGWTCISANYPLRTTYREQLAAARMAVAWARNTAPSYGADPDRVIVAGSSAGAHLAATLSSTDPTISGTICLGGYFGLADPDDPESAPFAHASVPNAPPLLVLHGDHDTIVIVDDAREFVSRMRDTSANAVIYGELKGAQHSFDIFRSPRMEAVVDVVDAFGVRDLPLTRDALAQLTAAIGCSVPQYLHFDAATGRSSDRHAGHVFTGAGSPNTVSPRRAMSVLYGTTMMKYKTAMNTAK